MYDIVGAIYEMLGSAKRPAEGLQAPDATSDEAPNVRVDRIFELLDSVSFLVHKQSSDDQRDKPDSA